MFDHMIPTNELDGLSRGSSRLRIAAYVLVGLGVAAGLLYGLLRPAGDGTGTVTGAVPDFELRLLDGSGTLSSDDLRGRPVVLNFWASWCIPCREEADLLEARWRAHRDDGVLFVGVNVRDLVGDAREFVREFDITFPIVRDPDQSLARAVGLVGLPQTFFITDEWTFSGTSAGAVVGEQRNIQWLGAITFAELEAGIRRLLNDAKDDT